jgi:tagatose 1,6-diphosphate aldolase
MTAVDQRPPIKAPIAAHYGLDEAPYDDVAGFKALLIETLQAESSAMLLDPHYAVPRGLRFLSPQKGLVVTLEDSVFRETGQGRVSQEIDNWSVGKIKRMGADAVKVLAWYRPDAGAAVCAQQRDFTKRIGEACQRFDIPFVFELLVYPLAADAHQTRDYVELKGTKADDVLKSVETFAAPDYGVDLFKLESPVNADDVPSRRCSTRWAGLRGGPG